MTEETQELQEGSVSGISIAFIVLRVTAAVIVGLLLFFFLGLTVVGWKVCCDFDSHEFTSRDEAVAEVVDGMGPVWPGQSIETRTNNAGDILVERRWLGVVELEATINDAEHERVVAENNDLEPTFATDAEYVFHNSYERGLAVLIKSALIGIAVAALMYLLLRVTRQKDRVQRESL